MPNEFQSTQSGEAQLKNYYDVRTGEKVSPTQEAIRRRRKKQAEKSGIVLKEDVEEEDV